MNGLSADEIFNLALFYAGYLYFPAAAILLWMIAAKAGFNRLFAGVILLGLSVLAYARFIEPRILLTVRHDVKLERCFAKAGKIRLAVISDTHQGVFGNEPPIARIARRIAEEKPDAVLIAGDLTYLLDPARFEETFAPLSTLDAPVYAVLGNHDDRFRGKNIAAPLSESLERDGVHVIDNAAETQVIDGEKIEFAGLSDANVARQDLRVVEAPIAYPRIALVHNPKLVRKLPKHAPIDLLVAGHTHGGQIYIPWLTCRLVGFACAVTRYGLVDTEAVKLFVTSGTGMVGLPLRFNVPPRIDVLNVSYTACGET